MELGAIITAIIASVGLLYTAIRIADDKGPLRRFERLAATRSSLEPGSSALRYADKALTELAKIIAQKESPKRQIDAAMMTLIVVMLAGTLGTAIGVELSRNPNVSERLVTILVATGLAFFGTAFLGLALLAASRLFIYLGARRYRLARRKVLRRRRRLDKAKREELRLRRRELDKANQIA